MRANNGLIRMAVLQALACASGLIPAMPGRASTEDVGTGPAPSAASSDSPDSASVQEVVIVGERQALETAQDIKLNSPTFVDSVGRFLVVVRDHIA